MEAALVLSIDMMAQRYGSLPSEVIKTASTFDLVIMDMALTFEQHNREKSQPGYVPRVSVEDLLKMKENV